MAASSRAPTAPRVASVSGSRLTTTSACGSSAGSSSVPWIPSRARRATPTTSQSNAPSIVASARPIDPKPRTRTRRFEASPSLTSSQCRRACCSATSRAPLASARIAAITHSAIARSRAPRALHRVTPAGTRSAIQSTPADSSCTTRSAGISIQRRQVLPARDDELDVGAGLGDDLDAGRRRAERVAVVGPGLHAAGSTRGSAARRRSRRSATSSSSRLSSSARSAAAMASEMRSVRASAWA